MWPTAGGTTDMDNSVIGIPLNTSSVPELITNPAADLFGVYARYDHHVPTSHRAYIAGGITHSDKLGNGTWTYGPGTVPVAVLMPGTASIKSMSFGMEHTCALTTSSIVYCLGNK
jgi:hypothetical protein